MIASTLNSEAIPAADNVQPHQLPTATIGPALAAKGQFQQQEAGQLVLASVQETQESLGVMESASAGQKVGARKKVVFVFVHGFQGSSEKTFAQFPGKLKKRAEATYNDLDVTWQVLPTYQTIGKTATVEKAVRDLLDYLPSVSEHNEQIILFGHSMGGVVALEAWAQARAAQSEHRLGEKIIGIVALDTPYYGLSQHRLESIIQGMVRTLVSPSLGCHQPLHTDGTVQKSYRRLAKIQDR